MNKKVKSPEGITFEEEDYNGEKLLVICYNNNLLEPVWEGEKFKGYRRKK